MRPRGNEREGLATAQPLLTPDVVLQEARELHRYWLSEKKPYSAGVVADCIATIENLLSRAPAPSAWQPNSEDRTIFVLKEIARGRCDNGRPLAGETARQMARAALDTWPGRTDLPLPSSDRGGVG